MYKTLFSYLGQYRRRQERRARFARRPNAFDEIDNAIDSIKQCPRRAEKASLESVISRSQ